MLRFLILLFVLPTVVLAGTWQDWLFNKNQQGIHLLKQNKSKEAAQMFTDKKWQAVANYQGGDYQKAYEQFKQDNGAQGLYNQGNALAHLEKYGEAIAAYKKALELQKDFPDAVFNKELVEKLLQQQKEQQQNQKDNKQQDKSKADQQNKQSQGKSEQQDKNKQDQSNKDKQDSKSGQDQKDGKEDQGQQPQAKPDQQNSASDQKPNVQQNNLAKPQNNSKPKDDKNQQALGERLQSIPEDKLSQDKEPVASYMKKQTPVDVEVKAELSKVPDDPGGLLRNKFLRDYQSQNKDNQ